MGSQLLLVSSEEEAWVLLTKAIQETSDFDGYKGLSFSRWPALNMHISSGDGALSTPLMEIFVEYQKALWRTYALIKYGKPRISFLTDEEKAALQFDVVVRQGSTDTFADLKKAAGALLMEAGKRLSGPQLVTLILGATLIVTGGVVFNLDLARRSELRSLETHKALSEQETARMKILQEAYAREPKLRDVEDLVQAPREKFLRNVPHDANIKFQGIQIAGCEANELARNTRRQGHIVVLRGKYRILEVDSRREVGFRVKVRNSQTGEELSAVLSDVPENSECKKRISKAQMERMLIPLVIESRRIGGKSVAAVILSAENPAQTWVAEMVASNR